MQAAVKDTYFTLDDVPVELVPPEKVTPSANANQSTNASQSKNANQTERAKQFLVSWTWPVPFPPNYEDQYKTMLLATGGGGGSGGCDGRGTPAKCKRCRYNAQSPSSSCCITVCVGYTSCSYATSGGKVIGCFNDPPTQCVSGGTGGLSSGVIMY